MGKLGDNRLKSQWHGADLSLAWILRRRGRGACCSPACIRTGILLGLSGKLLHPLADDVPDEKVARLVHGYRVKPV